MSDLTRLLESSRNPRTRALLHAGKRDAPARGASQRALLALAATTVAGGAAAAATKAGATASGGSSASGLVLTAVKWLTVGALSGSVLAAGAIAVQPRAVSSASARVVAAGASAVSRSTEPRSPSALDVAAEAPSPAPQAPSAAPAREAALAAPAASGPSDQGKLDREVRWIDAARKALAAGDATRALAELDSYDQLVETRILDREATVLRIEALLRQGNTGRARQLFDGYVRQYPGDAHITRLRAQWDRFGTDATR